MAEHGNSEWAQQIRAEGRHCCEGVLPKDGYGPAVEDCYEYEPNGRLFVSNEEYASQVNFCPYCGYQAKVPAITSDANPD